MSCLPGPLALISDPSILSQWPLFRFSIQRIYLGVLQRLGAGRADLVSDKLIDIKLHYSYLRTVLEHFHRGTTLIVGNNELEKLNPATISLLRGIHYRVYLISVLAEQLFDLLYALQTGKYADFKKNKWSKIIEVVRSAHGESIITAVDSELLLAFKSKYRTSELHKFSMVRAFTGKSEWSHLQPEQDALERVLQATASAYTAAA
jgi:hypothetical protein